MNPLMSIDLEDDSTRLLILETVRQEAYRLAKEQDKKNKKQQLKDYDKFISRVEKFKKREYVLVQNEAKKKFDLNWYGLYEVIVKKFLNAYILREIKNRKKLRDIERLISRDRLQRARVNRQLVKGQNMPTRKGKRRTYRSKLNP